MKRILALLLAVCMIYSLAGSAAAIDLPNDPIDDASSVNPPIKIGTDDSPFDKDRFSGYRITFITNGTDVLFGDLLNPSDIKNGTNIKLKKDDDSISFVVQSEKFKISVKGDYGIMKYDQFNYYDVAGSEITIMAIQSNLVIEIIPLDAAGIESADTPDVESVDNPSVESDDKAADEHNADIRTGCAKQYADSTFGTAVKEIRGGESVSVGKEFCFEAVYEPDPEYFPMDMYLTAVTVAGTFDSLTVDDEHDRYVIGGIDSSIVVDIDFDDHFIYGMVVSKIKFLTNTEITHYYEGYEELNKTFKNGEYDLIEHEGRRVDGDPQDYSFRVVHPEGAEEPVINIKGKYDKLVKNGDFDYTITGIVDELEVRVMLTTETPDDAKKDTPDDVKTETPDDVKKGDSDDTKKDTPDDTKKETPDDTKKESPDSPDVPDDHDKVIGLLGDVNRDGRISGKDSIMILRYHIKLEEFDEVQIKLADIDSDNKIFSKDSLYVLRYVVHQRVKYPVGTEVRG